MNINLSSYQKTIVGLMFSIQFISWTGQVEASTVSGVTIYYVSSELTSSNSSYDRAAIHVVDESGLDTVAQHTNAPDGTMWDANTFNPSLTTGATDAAPSITFNLGSQYALTSFNVWNYNTPSGFTGRGVKSVEISTSNNGTAYTDLGTFQFFQAPGTFDYLGEVIPLNVTTQFVRFNILSNYANDLTFGVGLSEVQFSGAPVPIPAAIWLFTSALAGFGVLNKRRSS
jgi:hypothetical protein